MELEPSDTSLSRDVAVKVLAISLDGERVTVAGWEQMFNVMIANNVPGVK